MVLRSFSNFSGPSLSARKEENHPSQGMELSVELVAEGAMLAASFALTALEAAGITVLAAASAAFFAGRDIISRVGVNYCLLLTRFGKPDEMVGFL